MNKIIKTLLAFTVAAALSACSGMNVSSDYSEEVDFTQYKTFAFISDKPLLVAQTTPLNPLFEGRAMTAVRNELANKGFQFVEDREQADFVISMTMGQRDKIRVNSYPSDYRTISAGGWNWGAPYHSEVDVRNYTEGTLAIDVFDVGARSPVWHGWATKTISMADRRNPTPVINDVIKAIMAQFPPS